MARINIEDSLYRDQAFIDLAIRLGSRRAALGALVEAFILAQEFYLSTETARLIPLAEWKRQRIADEVIEVGLAEIRGEGIYVRGSDEQFKWLLQRQAAGKQGGRPKATESDRFEPKATESGSNPLSLSLSLSQKREISSSTVLADEPPDTLAVKETKPVYFQDAKTLQSSLPKRTTERFKELYPDSEFIDREIIRAFGWYQDHPKKLPRTIRGWCSALSSWLEKGWKFHRRDGNASVTRVTFAVPD